jgi:23S rRNA pseudouridine1911/1915/1917 synthase
VALPEALAALGVGVLYIDDDLLVLDKPHGLPSQRGADGAPGIVDHARAAGATSAALVHRLDQTASGAIALATSPRGNRALTDALRTHAARRTYIAVLAAPIVATTWRRPLDAKAAVTHARPLSPPSGHQAVRVDLETGRTHQIRRHAALAGAPIVGDRRYGGDAGRAWPRLALHAARLCVPVPGEGNERGFIAPLPADLAELWAWVGGPDLATALADGPA